MNIRYLSECYYPFFNQIHDIIVTQIKVLPSPERFDHMSLPLRDTAGLILIHLFLNLYGMQLL